MCFGMVGNLKFRAVGFGTGEPVKLLFLLIGGVPKQSLLPIEEGPEAAHVLTGEKRLAP